MSACPECDQLSADLAAMHRRAQKCEGAEARLDAVTKDRDFRLTQLVEQQRGWQAAYKKLLADLAAMTKERDELRGAFVREADRSDAAQALLAEMTEERDDAVRKLARFEQKRHVQDLNRTVAEWKAQAERSYKLYLDNIKRFDEVDQTRRDLAAAQALLRTIVEEYDKMEFGWSKPLEDTIEAARAWVKS